MGCVPRPGCGIVRPFPLEPPIDMHLFIIALRMLMRDAVTGVYPGRLAPVVCVRLR
jgi:hypothetical protein